MSASVRQLNAIYNQNVMTYDEMKTLREVVKKGLQEVVDSTLKLDPTYVDPAMKVGAWRRVEEPREEDYRPLVKSDFDRVSDAQIQHSVLKKLNVI